MGNLTAIPPFLFLGRKNDSFCTIMLALSHNILYSTFKDGGKFRLELKILLSNEYVLFLTMSKLQQNFANNFANMTFSRKFSFSWHVSLTSLAKLIRKVTFSRNSHRKFAFCENHKSQFRFNYTYCTYSTVVPFKHGVKIVQLGLCKHLQSVQIDHRDIHV
jgi:hypothetical protein